MFFPGGIVGFISGQQENLMLFDLLESLHR